MVALGTDAGVHTVALLTDMSTPLGLTAGNALEVRESVEVLAGGGPADVVELTLALAREMLAGAGRRRRRPGRRAAPTARRWTPGGAMIAAQGGDPDAPLPVGPRDARRDRAGVRRADPAGRAGGRRRRVAARRRPGPQGGPGPGRRRRRAARQARATRSRAGEPLLELHTDEPGPVRARARRRWTAASYVIARAGSRPDLLPLVIDRVAR